MKALNEGLLMTEKEIFEWKESNTAETISAGICKKRKKIGIFLDILRV